MKELHLNAYAKVNLGLDVVRRLENGYHEVKMIMQSIELFDRVTIKKTDEPGIHLSMDREDLPVDQGNIAYRAASLLMDRLPADQGVDIYIEKIIPVAAGMAGGSTDGAAVLMGMNYLYGLGCSQDELMTLGLKLGADVPFCIMQGTALSEGIGEVLTRLPVMSDYYILIAKPSVSVSTKYVYQHLELNEDTVHPDIDGMREAIRKDDLDGVVSRMGNVLAAVTEKEHPEIIRLKELMLEGGAEGALMSGSGPTVFGIFKEKQQGDLAMTHVLESGITQEVFLVKPYGGV